MAQMVSTGPTQSTPVWIGDFLSREHVLPGGAQIDPSQFYATDSVLVTVGAAGALEGATSVPVDALPGALPSGALLDFGTNKFARLTAAATAGATSITVAAIPTALVDNDTARYAGVGKKTILSGTLVGRTITERDANTGFGPAADADDEVYLVVYDIPDATKSIEVELYRKGGLVKENYLPGIAAMSTALKTKIRTQYHCVKGA